MKLAIVLNPECKRFDTSIRRRSWEIENQSREFKGRKRTELLEGSTKIKVIRGECISALEVKQKAEQTEALDNHVTVVDELVDNLMGGVEELEQRHLWIDMFENKGYMPVILESKEAAYSSY